MPRSRSLFFDRWPRLITRHPWRVLMGAILAIAILGAISSTAGGTFVNQFSVPNTQAQQAIDLLQSRFPQQAGDSSTVGIKAPLAFVGRRLRPV